MIEYDRIIIEYEKIDYVKLTCDLHSLKYYQICRNIQTIKFSNDNFMKKKNSIYRSIFTGIWFYALRLL